MSGVKMSEMTADVVVDGTEELLALDGTTSKTLTTALMAAYSIDVLAAADSASPTTGDEIAAFRSDTEKLLDLDDVAAYVVASAWSEASTLTPLLTGDMLLVERAGTSYEANIDTIQTYVLDGVQDTVADLSTLDAGTPAAANLVLICQSGTGKQCSITALETLLWTDFRTYVAALSEATSLADTDIFYCAQGATPKAVTGELLVEYVSEQTSDWRLVAATKYTATPASTSQITMSDTSDVEVGLPVRYVLGANTHYGVVTALVENTSITIAGVSLSTDIASLHVGTASRVVHEEYQVNTAFGDAAQDVFADVTYERHRWRRGDARLVSFGGTLGVVDTGASQPKINITVDGSAVSTADTNKGIQLSGVAGTWVDNGAVAISSSNYVTEWDDEIDIECTEAGTNGDADVLSVVCVFVLE